MKVIFITHIHGDHHLGLFSFLLERQKYYQDPVFVVIPFNMASWVLKFSELVEKLNVKIIFSQNLESNSNLELNQFIESSMSKESVKPDLYSDPELIKYVQI